MSEFKRPKVNQVEVVDKKIQLDRRVDESVVMKDDEYNRVSMTIN